MDDVDLAILFSANRAYFLVDMEVPSAYVDFLRAILPDKTAAELYTMVGLQKAGKNLSSATSCTTSSTRATSSSSRRASRAS